MSRVATMQTVDYTHADVHIK